MPTLEQAMQPPDMSRYERADPPADASTGVPPVETPSNQFLRAPLPGVNVSTDSMNWYLQKGIPQTRLIPPSNPSTIGGVSSTTIINQIASTGSAKLPWINVVDLGADPTGAASSDGAIAAAVAEALTLPGAIIFFPEGIYSITTWPTLNAVRGLHFLGTGMDTGSAGNPTKGSILRWDGALNGTMLTWDGGNDNSINGFTFWGNSLADTAIVIKSSAAHGSMANMWVRNVSVLDTLGTDAILMGSPTFFGFNDNHLWNVWVPQGRNPGRIHHAGGQSVADTMEYIVANVYHSAGGMYLGHTDQAGLAGRPVIEIGPGLAGGGTDGDPLYFIGRDIYIEAADTAIKIDSSTATHLKHFDIEFSHLLFTGPAGTNVIDVQQSCNLRLYGPMRANLAANTGNININPAAGVVNIEDGISSTVPGFTRVYAAGVFGGHFSKYPDSASSIFWYGGATGGGQNPIQLANQQIGVNNDLLQPVLTSGAPSWILGNFGNSILYVSDNARTAVLWFDTLTKAGQLQVAHSLIAGTISQPTAAGLGEVGSYIAANKGRFVFGNRQGQLTYDASGGVGTEFYDFFTGHLQSGSDNTYDIGLASHRFRDLRLGRDVINGGNVKAGGYVSAGTSTGTVVAGDVSASRGSGVGTVWLDNAPIINPGSGDYRFDGNGTGGQIFPLTDATHNVGDAAHRWKDGWFSGTVTGNNANFASVAAITPVAGTAGATYTATEQGIINNLITAVNALISAL